MKTAITTVIAMISVVGLTLQTRPAAGGQAGNGFVGTKNLNVFPERLHSPGGILSGGWLLKTATVYVDSNGWLYAGATNHLYYQYANAASSVIQIWKDGAWVNSNLDSSTYDASGHQTTSLEMDWNNGAWVLGVQDTFVYNVNGYKASALERTWNGTAWVNSTYDSYTNDASGRPTVDVNQHWNGSAWVNVNRLSYTYNEYEGRTYALWETWSGSAWVNHGQEFVTFGANEEKSNVLQQVWKNGTWVNYTQDNYTYDANGHQTLDISQNWSSGAWVNYIQWTSTIDANGNKSDDVEQDWYKNSWRNSEWMHYTWERAGAMAVVAPVQGETILAGSFYEIQWHAPGSTAVDIDLSLDSARTFQTIAYNVPAENTYAWNVPDTLSAKCRIRIRDADDSTNNGQSNPFRIKPYILTRFKADGDYELYNPAIHGWQFRNRGADMWPQSWWKQFNYVDGPDPFTGRPYNRSFYDFTVGLQGANFVDWPLFVRLFSADSCYKNVAEAVYSPLAVRLWNHYKDFDYDGSCFGFAVSSVLGFEHPTELLQRFPEIGAFQNLHDLPLDSLRSRAVNELYETQYGFPAWQEWESADFSHTPRMTLGELKNMLRSDSAVHRTLSITDPRVGGHALTPYRMQRDAATGLWYLYVYDCNCLSADCQGVIVIDSLNDSWQYPASGWMNKDKGLVLSPDPLKYLGAPGLWEPPSVSNQVPVASPGTQHVLATSYARLFNSDAAITITNANGETAGFQDSTTFDGFSNGMPIIPVTGGFHRPIGYYVPSGTYAVRMYGFVDSSAVFSGFDYPRMFTCWRMGAEKSQSDLLTYNNGLSIGNPDQQTKNVNLECITKVGSGERVFQIQNCSAIHNDSLGITAPDADRLTFVNWGPRKTYGLNIELAGSTGLSQFVHAAITMPANSSHYIAPDWPNLSSQPVKIYEDIGNTGAIHDTLSLANQAAGVKEQLTFGIPREFRLEQNYPNPFNPSTTIRYGLPHKSAVQLKVYNTLGQQVATLVNGEEEAGYHEVRFDGSGLASGVYLYRIQAGTFVQTRKLLLLK